MILNLVAVEFFLSVSSSTKYYCSECGPDNCKKDAISYFSLEIFILLLSIHDQLHRNYH